MLLNCGAGKDSWEPLDWKEIKPINPKGNQPWILIGRRRSNHSFLKEITPGSSLKGLMLKLKFQYFGHLMRRVDSLEKTLMLGGIGGRIWPEYPERYLNEITWASKPDSGISTTQKASPNLRHRQNSCPSGIVTGIPLRERASQSQKLSKDEET